MPSTRGRTVRVPDPLWQAALDRAAQTGTTVTQVVLTALEKFTANPPTRRTP